MQINANIANVMFSYGFDFEIKLLAVSFLFNASTPSHFDIYTKFEKKKTLQITGYSVIRLIHFSFFFSLH